MNNGGTEKGGGRPVAASQRPTGGDKAIAGKKQYFRRKKVCRFCVEKIDDINYKDMRLLQQLHLRARQDHAPPHLRRVRAASAAPGRSHQAGAQHRAAAVRLARGLIRSWSRNAMEVILREDIEKLGTRGPGGQGRRRATPAISSCPSAWPSRPPIQQEDRRAGAPSASPQGSQARRRGTGARQDDGRRGRHHHAEGRRRRTSCSAR